MSVTSKALWYIESHFGEDLSLETIADAVGVSRFHLCRAFDISAGHSPAGYVRSRRLSEAARQLVNGAPDILAIALDSGYGSHEAFTRAFRQHFDVTPEQVRSQAHVHNLKLQEPIRMDQTTITPLASPRLVKSEALLLFGLSQHYNCSSKAGIASQWSRFVPHLGHIPGQVGRDAFGVIYNFQNSDDGGTFDYLTGVEVKEIPNRPSEFTSLRIPPQSYAVFEHKDHISAITATWKAIWEQGLPSSGYQAADAPAFERYGEQFDGHTGLGGLELWVPVKV